MKKEIYIDSDGQELTKKTWHNGDIEYKNKEWKRHRLDGPARINSSGTEYWFHNGKLHRLDGPAVIWFDDYQAWYSNGKFHREDAPARIWPSGKEEYWLNGREVSKKEIDLLWLKKQVEK